MLFRRRVIGSINIKDIAVVTCVSKVYNGQTQVATNITVTFKGETLTQGVDYTIIENAGGTNVGSYNVKIKGIKKYSGEAQGDFSIEKVTPTVTAPTAITSLVYNGSNQALIAAGSTDYGTLQYSLDDSSYSTGIPSGMNATSYTVYYKVEGDSNINGVPAQSVSASIAKANQAAPIATGATTTYNTTATATASGGGGQGTIEWESSQSQTSVGSHATRARWSGNSNYNASDGKTVLDLSDDAAQAAWGGSWRIPSTVELQALQTATTSAWTSSYEGSGVAGLVLTSNADSSKKLFFPANGECLNGGVYDVGTFGHYYTNMLYSRNKTRCYYMDLRSEGWHWSLEGRYNGFSVRGVVGQ